MKCWLTMALFFVTAIAAAEKSSLFPCVLSENPVPYAFLNDLPWDDTVVKSGKFFRSGEISREEHEDLRWLFTHPDVENALAEFAGERHVLGGAERTVSCYPGDAHLYFRRTPVQSKSTGYQTPVRFKVNTEYTFTLDLWCPDLATAQEGYYDYFHFRAGGEYRSRVPYSDQPLSSEMDDFCGMKRFQFEISAAAPVRVHKEELRSQE